jgi:orotidine-5'-phosphate decarboxylase
MKSFFEKLGAIVEERDSMLCVGLDCDVERLPACCRTKSNPQLWFNQQIIEATKDLVAAYKPNIAFYESAGMAGMEALHETLKIIPPEIPIIADAKRGDIGNTSRHYAQAIFDTLGFGAVTLSPYMGFDSLAPFFEYRDRGMFVLCLTSNPGADDFELPNNLFLEVARKCKTWNEEYGNVGLVTGAPFAEQLGAIRQEHPEGWFLVPGVGAQGGDLAAVIANGQRKSDKRGMIINVSRSVIFASAGDNFAEKAREEALKVVQCIREAS